jgi:hypothetical protein
MTTTTNTDISIIYGTYSTPAGYYLFSPDGFGYLDLTLCKDCYSSLDDRCDEDCADDEPIGYWHETDAPVHCTACYALLVTSLTRDGVEWLRDAIVSPHGRDYIKRAWITAFEDELTAR